MLKAIIFDMDDTLIDWSGRSEEWQQYERRHLERVFNYIAREVHPVRNPEMFYETARNLSRQAWLEAERGLIAPNLGTVMGKALEHIGVPADLIDIDACLHAYDWEPVSGVAVYPHTLEVLATLVSNGLKIGLITNAFQPMWMRDRELKAYGLLEHFAECRLSAADVGYLKPHPSIFENALSCLGVRAQETVFVGDNLEADVSGAQSVGMRAVLRSGSPVQPLVSGLITPDATIDNLLELLPILDQWYPGWHKTPHPTPTTARLDSTGQGE